MKTMQIEWLKFKKYPHIGKPLVSSKDRVWVENYVIDSQNIVRHKFVPLLHRVLTQRKFRPDESALKNSSGKRIRTNKGKKERHIYYPSHLDSIIYSYYNDILTQAYEKYLSDKDYASVAVAYRKIPKNDLLEGNKCNIEFAADAFLFIRNNRHRRLSVIVADVTSFFDNLDHRLLHKQWKKVLNVEDLPADHYKIYKNLVDYKYVNENELFKRFQHKLIVERHKPNDASSVELKRKYVSKIYHLRHENVVAYCYADEFFREATDLIRVDKPFNKQIREKQGKQNKRGIPQGTPLSATLANIYMLDFDAKIYEEASKPYKNVYYQRYSDDLILLNDKHVNIINNLIYSSRPNSYVYLPNNVKVVRSYNDLIIKEVTEEVDSYELEIGEKNSKVVLPNGKVIEVVEESEINDNNYARLNKEDLVFPLHIRTRKVGDKMYVKGMNKQKKVKDIFINSKIPLSKRDIWPIVVDSKDKVVWIPGIKKSKFDIPKNKKCDIILRYY